MRSLTAALLATSLLGCTLAGRSTPADPSPGYYDYARGPLTAERQSLETADGWQKERLLLTGPAGSNFPPLQIDWYRPQKPGRHPAVLMSPILAGNDLYVAEFARFYAARGLHAVLLYRKKERFSADRPLSDIEDHLRESVIQLRRAIDWLETQESVDPARIGSFSISMGAILMTILAAVEPRVRCSVLGLPAGHVPEILMTSKDKGIVKRRNNYLRENDLSPEKLLEQLKKTIHSEPLAYAPKIRADKTLIIAGLFDRVLGLNRSLELWRAMGRPRLILLPTGHYSATLATPYLKVVTYSFLRRNLQ